MVKLHLSGKFICKNNLIPLILYMTERPLYLTLCVCVCVCVCMFVCACALSSSVVPNSLRTPWTVAQQAPPSIN